ncbi:MAG: hypothetical protein Q9183_004574, partial [Haloplaca sp. 2 TL-2023]
LWRWALLPQYHGGSSSSRNQVMSNPKRGSTTRSPATACAIRYLLQSLSAARLWSGSLPSLSASKHKGLHLSTSTNSLHSP